MTEKGRGTWHPYQDNDAARVEITRSRRESQRQKGKLNHATDGDSCPNLPKFPIVVNVPTRLRAPSSATPPPCRTVPAVSYFTRIVNVSLLPASFRSFGTRHEYPQVPSQPKGILPSETFLPEESVIVTIGSSESGRS